MSIDSVGVVGCGLMGSGIAQVCAAAGLRTWVCELNDEALEAGMARLRGFLDDGVSRGKLSEADRASTLEAITPASSLDALSEVDLVVEAIVEDMGAKKSLFEKLDRVLRPEAVRCTNTSSLCVTELAASTRAPELVAGLHFFNPVPLMPVVEIIPTLMSREGLTEELISFAPRARQDARRRAGSARFLVNRLLVPYLLDAVRALEDGTARRKTSTPA